MVFGVCVCVGSFSSAAPGQLGDFTPHTLLRAAGQFPVTAQWNLQWNLVRGGRLVGGFLFKEDLSD